MELVDFENLDIKKIVNYTQSVINFDNSELIKSAKEITAKYKDLVICEDDIKEMKKVRAGFNKIIKSLTVECSGIKQEYNKPFNTFKDKIDAVTDEINKAGINLDTQIKAFELKLKEKKYEEIKIIKDEIIIELGLNNKYSIQLEIIDSYLNATTKTKQIREDLLSKGKALLMQQEAEKVQEELKLQQIKNRELLINNLNSQYKMSFTYSNFMVDRFTDEQVYAKYRDLYEIEMAKSSQAQSIESNKPEKDITWDVPQRNEPQKCEETQFKPETPQSDNPGFAKVVVEIIAKDQEKLSKLLAAIKTNGFTINIL